MGRRLSRKGVQEPSVSGNAHSTRPPLSMPLFNSELRLVVGSHVETLIPLPLHYVIFVVSGSSTTQ